MGKHTNLHIREATAEDLPLISQLAERIWWPTYGSILSAEQIEFMLENSYSTSALQQAMDTGQQFYVACEEDEFTGFLAVKVKDQTTLRIEKLYLLPSIQGRGYGKALIDYVAEVGKANNLKTLELNVNRGNRAYHFYLKQGFEVVEEVDIPYHGFILDDYIMHKVLLP